MSTEALPLEVKTDTLLTRVNKDNYDTGDKMQKTLYVKQTDRRGYIADRRRSGGQ